MKSKSALSMLVVSLAAIMLVGCSTTGDADATGTSVSDFNGNGGAIAGSDGASTAGLGEDSGFEGDAAGNGNALRVGTQTYYFDFDRSQVRDSDKASIDVQANYLATHPNAKVLLEGNTDPRGSREYNIALGERRALAVADALKLQGVSSKQIRTVSYGAEKLASNGHTDEDYQLDRRVNLSYESK